jgi:hypothetical protein
MEESAAFSHPQWNTIKNELTGHARMIYFFAHAIKDGKYDPTD